MMSWLAPIGFLGLIGLIILILIWILKPNYQQKFISSTYVWELSLKYKKKKIPINKLRNILLFLCQVLIISICSAILAQPIIRESQPPMIVDKVAIIDASANMRTAYDQESRFERAVFGVQELAEEAFEEGGFITVIFAGAEASYIAQRVDESGAFDLEATLNDLVQNDACTFGNADINGAIDLAQKIVDQNVDAEVYLYTATEYLDDGGEVTIVPVGQNGEWNAAILNCQALIEENYYTFKTTVAAYERDISLTVYCEVKGANSAGLTIRYEKTVTCSANQTKTVSFATGSELDSVYEFDSVRIYIDENDSFKGDNDFYVYGGRKPELNMLYYNPHANIFVGGAMKSARSTFTDWDITYTEINTVPEKSQFGELPVEGYDFYVYEGSMPDVLPTDGVIMLINMDKTPEGLTAVMGQEVFAPSVDRPFTLSFTEYAHPITQYLNPDRIEVTKYTRLLNYDGFTPLLYCNGEPVLFVKDNDGQKIVMMTFSVNFSMISMYVEFPILMYNIIEYFMPSTLSGGNTFDINQTISLNARSDELSISSVDGSYSAKITEFPQEIVLTTPGTYTVSQLPISGIPQVEQFFVKIPASQSNICRVEEELYDLIVPKKRAMDDYDLLLYFAAALVALVFFERLLQSQDS